jgi:hypothetical protein
MSRRARLRLLRASLVCLVGVCGFVASGAQLAGASTAQVTPHWGLLEQTSQLGAMLSANSCAGRTFCGALVSNDESTNGTALIIDRDGNWSQPIEIPYPIDDAAALSCPSIGTCIVGDSSGRVAIYHDGQWSTRLVSGRGTPQSEVGVLAVSCAAASTCTAVNSNGDAITDHDGHWSQSVRVDAGTGLLDAISCPTVGFCAAVDGIGRVVIDRAGTWSAPVRIDANALVAISCGTAQSCVALDILGDVLTWSGGGWSRPYAIDTEGATPSAIACATATLCFAADSLGRTLRFDGTAWAQPQIHDQITAGVEFGVPGFVSISCPSAQFCQAVDASGNAVNYGG